jgi:hypothetical protein
LRRERTQAKRTWRPRRQETIKFAVDPNKENLARLSVDRAMEVMVGEWSPGAAEGRAKLLERLEASKKTQSFE